jgi:hypothetical protein
VHLVLRGRVGRRRGGGRALEEGVLVEAGEVDAARGIGRGLRSLVTVRSWLGLGSGLGTGLGSGLGLGLGLGLGYRHSSAKGRFQKVCDALDPLMGRREVAVTTKVSSNALRYVGR